MIWLKFLGFFLLELIYHFDSPFIFFCHRLVLNPIGIQSVTFLTSFISTILLGRPHPFILCGFIYQ